MAFIRTLARIFLIATNILELFGGVAIMVAGSLALSSAQKAEGDDAHTMKHATIASIVLGGVVALQAFLGCCGALKQKRALLILYAICVALMLLVTAIMTIFAFVATGSTIPNFLRESLLQYDENDSGTPSTEHWDLTQQSGKCCGVHDFSDWWAHSQYDASGRRFPKSCCKEPASTDCDPSNPTPGSFFTRGCYEAILLAQTQIMPVLAYILLGTTILLALSFICVLILLCSKGN